MRHLASHRLAKAVKDLFPQVHLLGGEGTTKGFYYDFRFPFQFQRSMIPLIEEKMRQETEETIFMEMAAASASALLKEFQNPERIDQIETPLVFVAKTDNFADLVSEPISDKIGFFKIVQALPIQGGIRLFGDVKASKADLKVWVKKWQPIEETRFKEYFLFNQEEGIIWLPKAEKIRENLVELWTKKVGQENFQVVTTHSKERSQAAERHLMLGVPKTAEILSLNQKAREIPYQPSSIFIDQFYLQTIDIEREFISSLQFILKFLKIFSFDLEVVSSSKRALDLARNEGESVRLEKRPRFYAEVRIADIFGRFWPGPYVSVDPKKKTVIGSLLGPMERFVALLIEQRREDLETLMSRLKQFES